MASVAQRHAYRFGYLKSDHWSNLRLSKLVEQDAKCQVCGHRDLSNDVHHVVYRASLYDTSLDDLVVLCRECHNDVHEVLRVFESITKDYSEAQTRWALTLTKLKKVQRYKFRMEYFRIFRVQPPSKAELRKGLQAGKTSSLQRLKPIRELVESLETKMLRAGEAFGCPETTSRKTMTWFARQRKAKLLHRVKLRTPTTGATR